MFVRPFTPGQHLEIALAQIPGVLDGVAKVDRLVVIDVQARDRIQVNAGRDGCHKQDQQYALSTVGYLHHRAARPTS